MNYYPNSDTKNTMITQVLDAPRKSKKSFIANYPNSNSLIRFSFLLLLCSLFLVSCDNSSDQNTGQSESKNTEHQPLISNQAIILNNQGVGEMGSFDYDKAVISFEKLVSENKDWNIAQQNLAIALLNRQKPGDEERAMKLAEDLSQLDDSNLVAHYIVAILKFNQGLCEQANPHFESIIKADKKDAYALYFSAQCFLQNGQAKKSLTLYQQAIDADSYLRSAYYGGFMAAQRLEKTELAKEMLNAYQKLASNPKARLAEIKYTRMGPKANAQAYAVLDETIQKPELKAPFFSSAKAIKGLPEAIQQFGFLSLQHEAEPEIYTITDNRLQLFQNYLIEAQEISSLSLNLKEGQHQLAWGDINNDGKIDVYITGSPDQMYEQVDQQGTVSWQAIDMNAFGFGSLSSKAVRLSDADHDGDLDVLLLSEKGQFELWNNNLNSTFSALSKKVALPSENGFKAIYVQDMDADRDADIVLLSDHAFVTLFNDRMWDYQIFKKDKFKQAISSLSLADNNTNGLAEISLNFEDGSGQVVEYSKENSDYTIINQNITHDKRTIDKLLFQIDVNGNGEKEYLWMHSQGITVSDEQGNILQQIMQNGIQTVKVLSTITGPELLTLRKGELWHHPSSTQRWPYILLHLSGKEDSANSVRSNFSGMGTSLVIRNENFYATADSFHNLSGVDQDFQAIAIAAGAKEKSDYLALEWSDGVYQTELGLKTGQFHAISETQRQLSSCPVIFVWNKGQYHFVSDVLGVGGIGFAVGRKQYGIPRPWENYLLNSQQISSENGVFKLQFTEPMEESAYLDQLTIQVVDVPEPWKVILDERMGISDPQVTGKLLYYQQMVHPQQVLTKSGIDVTELALKTDKRAIKIENQDRRFLGLLDEQIINMEFDKDLQGDYVLVMNGWVEYGYSQTMFAAWQAGKEAQAPTLEYYDAQGQWQVLLKNFGYPAGMPRAASVPFHLPEKSNKLRIRTTMEVYFDELGLIQPQEISQISKHNLKLKQASLKQLGYPKREDNKQRVPTYDYDSIQPFWDTRYMQGAYTQLGEISELLTQHDNALAIIAAGEAIELEFIDDLPVLEEGYQRYYLLKFKGWAKDMDILTHQGETLAPIPSTGVISAKAKQLNKKYNNRFKAGK